MNIKAIRLFFEFNIDLLRNLPMGLEFLYLENPTNSTGEYIDLNLPPTLNHLYIMKTNFMKFAEYKVPYGCEVTYMEALYFQVIKTEGRLLNNKLKALYNKDQILDFYTEEEFKTKFGESNT
jgi:hypothetical protein